MNSIKLHKYWNDFARNLGAEQHIDDTWKCLYTKYSENHRVYHTLDHIEACLIEFDWCRKGFSKESCDAIEMAIWFHDVVYDPASFDNEEKSARLAKFVLKQIIPDPSPILIAKVRHLIRCTKHGSLEYAITEEEDVFLDIDLSILGAEPEVFDKYEKDIRREYSFVPYDIYCFKRAEILQSFLDRPRIYKTKMFEYIEHQARENISESISKLQKVVAQ